MKFIYISTTMIPSKKANTYQSFCVCESFLSFFPDLEFWHPARRGDYTEQSAHASGTLEQVFLNFGVERRFKLARIFCLDLVWLQRISLYWWFFFMQVSFCFSAFLKICVLENQLTVFTRDGLMMAFLGIAKWAGLLRAQVFFEAHRYSRWEKVFSGLVDGVIAINGFVGKKFSTGHGRKVLVAHDAVNRAEFKGRNDKYEGFPKEKKVILYSGNLFRWKGVFTLVDATRFLPDTCQVVFLGGSPDTLEFFRKYVGENPKITIVGHVPRKEVSGYLAAADVLVLPNSHCDPLSSYTSPLKLFEYMASRKPIVASRMASIQEVIRDGENGILFSPDDSQDLAEKILWVLANDCHEIVECAWRDVQSFTWEKRAEKIIRWMHG